ADTRSESPLGSPPRDPPGTPLAGTPTGTAAEVIREKGPALAQSRRQPPPTTSPPAAAFPRWAADTARENPRQTTREAPETRAPRGGPHRAPGGRREEGDGATAPQRARASPAPPHTPARPTQPLEPILIPVTDLTCRLPLLPCSNMPEAVHLGDLLRIWVRSGVRLTPSPRIFKGQRELTDAEPRRFQGTGPYLGRTHSRAPALHKEKRTLPGPASFSGFSGFAYALSRLAPARLSPHLQTGRCARPLGPGSHLSWRASPHFHCAWVSWRPLTRC
uniref:Uncharacterized protein n=1 Tax=Oreochromis aureus TaxID=47969 RepID=A0AAZ1XB11_OREAU